MNPRDAVIRRVLFWLAMTAGTGLVATQFACGQPRPIPVMADHHSVDRLPLSRQATLPVVQPDTGTRLGWWVRSQRTAKAKATTASASARSKASGSASAALYGE